MPSNSCWHSAFDDCRALHEYQVSIVAAVLQFAGMGQCKLAIINIVVIMLMYLVRHGIHKAKFRFNSQGVTL